VERTPDLPTTIPAPRPWFPAAARMLRSFFDANRKLTYRLEPMLPQAREHLFEAYESTVAQYMNARPNQLVVDVGGGKSCPFSKYREPALGTRIVAVDISEAEMRDNSDVDEARVGNIMQELPFEPGEVDLIVSRSVLEHLVDLDSFVATSQKVLKPGGYFIHLLPGRYAPFAVINRSLPSWLSRKVLYFFQPRVIGICGFPAFYDKCNHSALAKSLHAHGLELEECRVSYYQSQYFNFFVPLYLVSVAYELVARAVGARELAAYYLIIARKQ
jgi:SAM-dependent methyltransferase